MEEINEERFGFEENYFFDTSCENRYNEKQYFVLIIYDISDNKRRNRMVKTLKRYGFRVQKSAFEALLKPNKYEKLLKEIKKIPDSFDNVRVYKIQGKGFVENFGAIIDIHEDEVIII